MNLIDKFSEYVKSGSLFQKGDRLLVAVSGGLDSVVLCELCRRRGYDFAIAHCNFQLRGQESDGDEEFVQQLAKKYGVGFFVKKTDAAEYALEKKLSIQVAAREIRYQWFNELLNETTGKPFNWLLTAHHAADNMETILMNFFKGSGINGLKGILPKQRKLVRPLLFADRKDIESFAKELGLEWREDSSNTSDKYTRNYFRNQLIPGLEKVFPQVKENIMHNAERFRDIHTLYRQAVDSTLKKLVEKKGEELHIPVLKLLKTDAHSTILYELIKDYGFTAQQTGEVLGLLRSESGKYVQSPTHRVLRNRQWLIISPLLVSENRFILIAAAEGRELFPAGILEIKKQTITTINSDPNIAMLDASLVKFPLLLRRWKQGDYFYPLGMQKKKKLSRFFIDQKLSLIEKENTWVLEMNKKICWIVGQRIDDRFKITGQTKDLVCFSFKREGKNLTGQAT